MVPQALRREVQRDRVADGDRALALDPRHHAALMRGTFHELRTPAGMMLVDDLADIAARRILDVDDQGCA